MLQAYRRTGDVAVEYEEATEQGAVGRLPCHFRLFSRLHQLHPGVDFTPALNGYVDDNSLWMLNTADPKFQSDTRPKPGVDSSLPLPLPQPTLVIDDIGPEGLDPSDDEFSAPSLLERSFKAMSLHTGPPRFLGKSSRFAFFKKVFNYKYEQAGVEPPNFFNKVAETMARKRTELFLNQPVSVTTRPRCFPPLDTL